MPSCNSTNASALPDLSGRVCIVTGGNSGIGQKTVENLALRGARVYMGARDASKAEAAIKLIRSTHPSSNVDIQILLMDLSSLASVHAAADTFLAQESKLHILVNNAGVMGVPFQMTKDQFEVQLQSNYIGHWLLTRRLIPLMLTTSQTAPRGATRIVNVSSDGHDIMAPKEGIPWNDMSGANLSPMQRYGASKLANVLHAKTLHQQFGPGSAAAQSGQGEIWTASVHPGYIHTNLQKGPQDFVFGTLLPPLMPVVKAVGLFKTPDQGCATSLFCAANEKFTADMSGLYFSPNAKVISPSKNALNTDLRDRLEAWTKDELQQRKFDLSPL